MPVPRLRLEPLKESRNHNIVASAHDPATKCWAEHLWLSSDN